MDEREMRSGFAFLRASERRGETVPSGAQRASFSSGHGEVPSTGAPASPTDAVGLTSLDAMLASIPDPAWVTDQNSRMLACNAGVGALLGFSREEMLGRTVAEYMPASVADGALRDDRQVLERGEPLRIEEQVPGAHGVQRWLETVKSPLRGPTGAVVGILGIARDVTERRQAVEAQQESLRFFSALDRLTSVLAQARDIEGLIVAAIETTRDVFQCDRAWLLSPCDPEAPRWKVIFESTHPQYPGALALGLEFPMEATIAGIFREALATEGTVEFGRLRPHPWAPRSAEFDIRSQLHIALRPKVGQAWLFGLHQCSYVRDWTPHDRRLFAVFAARFTDALTNLLVTRDLRHSVQALGESESNFRAIAENASAGILLFAGGKNVYANADALAMTGYSAAELAGRGLAHLIEGSAGVDGSRESFLRDSTGRRIPIEVSQATSLWRGQPAELVFLRDISERRRVEDERRHLLERTQEARAAAEKANRAKDSFLAVVSHELRTPLTSILAWAQMLRRGRLDEKSIQRAAETIERLSRTQNLLINDLLDVTNVVSGNFSLDERPVDVGPLVVAAVDSLRSSAEAKTIELVAEGCVPGTIVLGDSTRLQQVLRHLLTNAIKFTPPGGRVRAFLSSAEGQCLVAVEDTGQGIPPDFRPHLFDPFTQADASSTRAHGGLGLGLAIVRSIVECHGGRVWATSEGEGRGATFWIALPLLAQAEAGGHATGLAGA